MTIPANSLPDSSLVRFQPVVIGGDIGAYSLSRAFWEAYGVKTIVLSTFVTGPVGNSRFIENHLVSRLDDSQVLLETLNDIAAKMSDTPVLLVGSADWHVQTLVALRPQLADNCITPYPSAEILAQATDKAEFSARCQKLGLPHPQTLVHQIPGVLDMDVLKTMGSPIIGKAGSSAEFHHIDYPGKRKVYEFNDPQQTLQELKAIEAAGYRGSFILQRKILGNDEQMRILTCYCDKQSRVVSAVYGRVLLEEHTPGALGNPAGIISEINTPLVQQIAKLLKDFKWVGYANFDIKVDPITGQQCIFELNPRLGRSNYYVTMTGYNPVVNYVREYIQGLEPLPNDTTQVKLYTVLPFPLLFRYVQDKAVRARLRALKRQGKVVNPLICPDDMGVHRKFYVLANQLRQWSKYRRNYPLALHKSLAFNGASSKEEKKEQDSK